MSADCVLSAAGESDETAARDAETCRAPNCWRDGGPVRVDDETAVPAVLCDEHARLFLGVSS
jgi:hypothetical protein